MIIYAMEPLPELAAKGQQIYITYDADDTELVKQNLTDKLIDQGFVLTCNVRSKELCSRNDYISQMTEKIRSSGVGIVVLPKVMLQKNEPDELESLLWYEIGYIKSSHLKLIPYLLNDADDERKKYLNESPIQQIQGTNNTDTLITFLKKWRISSRVFFEDRNINRYAIRRIRYLKIASQLNVRQKHIESMLQSLNENDDEITDSVTVLNDFLEELKCGCTVMRFNDQSEKKEKTAPYYPENIPIKQDFPTRRDYFKPVIVNRRRSDDVIAVVQVGFLLPVHQLFGVTFKPFVSISKKAGFTVKNILDILKSDGQDTDPNKDDFQQYSCDDENRIYFLFDVDTVESGEQFKAFGEKLNHIWPV